MPRKSQRSRKIDATPSLTADKKKSMVTSLRASDKKPLLNESTPPNQVLLSTLLFNDVYRDGQRYGHVIGSAPVHHRHKKMKIERGPSTKKHTVDAMLSAVAHMYYRDPSIPFTFDPERKNDLSSMDVMHQTRHATTKAKSSSVDVNKEVWNPELSAAIAAMKKMDGEDPIAAHLNAPRRQPHVLDKWSPRDIGMFEQAMCCFGKDFALIQTMLPWKSVADCIEFYHVWKKSSHYYVWKKIGKFTTGAQNERTARHERLRDLLDPNLVQ